MKEKTETEWVLTKEKVTTFPQTDYDFCTKTSYTTKITWSHSKLPDYFSIYILQNEVVALHAVLSWVLKQSCATKGFRNISLADGLNNTYAIVCHKDKEKIIELIDLINQEYFLGDIKNTLLRELGIRESKQGMSNKILQQLEQGDFHAAIALGIEAQNMGYHEVLWTLISKLHQDKLVDEHTLITLYKSIKEESNYFLEANERLFILYKPELFPEQTKQNAFFCDECQLDAALSAKNDTLIKHTLHRLSDKGFQPCDNSLADVLIQLTTELRELKSENQQLKEQLNSPDIHRKGPSFF